MEKSAKKKRVPSKLMADTCISGSQMLLIYSPHTCMTDRLANVQVVLLPGDHLMPPNTMHCGEFCLLRTLFTDKSCPPSANFVPPAIILVCIHYQRNVKPMLMMSVLNMPCFLDAGFFQNIYVHVL